MWAMPGHQPVLLTSPMPPVSSQSQPATGGVLHRLRAHRGQPSTYFAGRCSQLSLGRDRAP
jgi:hypothetical protein